VEGGHSNRWLMLGDVVSQDGSTKPARTAVDQDNQLLLAQTQLLELANVQDFLNGLEFGGVITDRCYSLPAVDRPHEKQRDGA
jgi:hypothetical protein